MTDGLDLDHVAVVVRDLDVAEANFTRLGFRLTRRSSHEGPVPPEGTIGPWGTGNHCAMFRQGYLELLGITDPDLYHAHLVRRLARHEGLHLIAFGTGDAVAAVENLRPRGVAIADPADVGRAVPYGSGTRPGRFGIANLDPDVYPEADFIVIEQKTRDVLWQPDLMAHPNGAVSLESVTVATPDPDGLIARLTPILGAPSGGTFALDPGRLHVLDSQGFARAYPGCRPPGDLPCAVAVAIGVESLTATEACLRANGVDIEARGAGLIRVGAETGCGAVVDFVEISGKEKGR